MILSIILFLDEVHTVKPILFYEQNEMVSKSGIDLGDENYVDDDSESQPCNSIQLPNNVFCKYHILVLKKGNVVVSFIILICVIMGVSFVYFCYSLMKLPPVKNEESSASGTESLEENPDTGWRAAYYFYI